MLSDLDERWGEEPAVIERGEMHLNMRITAHIFRQSFLEDIHSAVDTKSDKNSSVWNEKKSSNPGFFLTSAKLANHGAKWPLMTVFGKL